MEATFAACTVCLLSIMSTRTSLECCTNARSLALSLSQKIALYLRHSLAVCPLRQLAFLVLPTAFVAIFVVIEVRDAVPPFQGLVFLEQGLKVLEESSVLPY